MNVTRLIVSALADRPGRTDANAHVDVAFASANAHAMEKVLLAVVGGQDPPARVLIEVGNNALDHERDESWSTNEIISSAVSAASRPLLV